MKQEELQKYTEICNKIRYKIGDIKIRLPYGISREDKAFLELVNDLIK